MGRRPRRTRPSSFPSGKWFWALMVGGWGSQWRGQVLPCSHSFQLYNCIIRKLKKNTAFTELPQYSTWIRSTKSPQQLFNATTTFTNEKSRGLRKLSKQSRTVLFTIQPQSVLFLSQSAIFPSQVLCEGIHNRCLREVSWGCNNGIPVNKRLPLLVPIIVIDLNCSYSMTKCCSHWTGKSHRTNAKH